MGKPIIKIENLSKQYRLGLVSTKTLTHDLNRWWQVNILGNEDPYLKIGETNDRASKGESEYVWALKDINLEIEEGEVLGIIGKNGAGKSTLLKILSKVTAPSTGTIKARGRIASLLEVGTGFHQEMTGRENIYLNGAILGMTKTEINRKFDEIVDFAGVERYIDTPVKRYSSGMLVRLGFAVAAHLEPEILIVDEVLAVGDAEFQKKALGKMQDVSKKSGRTVLFVSHNIGAVKTLCNSGLLLDRGSIVCLGDSHFVVNEYLQRNIRIDLTKNRIISECKRFELDPPFLTNINGEVTYNFAFGEKIILNFKMNFFERVEKINPGYAVLDLSEQRIFTSHLIDDEDFQFNETLYGQISISTMIDLPSLAPGRYKIIFGIRDENERTVIYNEDCITFEIDQIKSKNGAGGLLWYTSKWKIIQ